MKKEDEEKENKDIQTETLKPITKAKSRYGRRPRMFMLMNSEILLIRSIICAEVFDGSSNH